MVDLGICNNSQYKPEPDRSINSYTHPSLTLGSTMPLLQFTPLQSRPSASFWSSLTSLKLDTLKLDDAERDVLGFLDEGMSVKDRSASKEGKEEEVWVAGSLGVDERSLEGGR
jgi:hypothetical protein